MERSCCTWCCFWILHNTRYCNFEPTVVCLSRTSSNLLHEQKITGRTSSKAPTSRGNRQLCRSTSNPRSAPLTSSITSRVKQSQNQGRKKAPINQPVNSLTLPRDINRTCRSVISRSDVSMNTTARQSSY